MQPGIYMSPILSVDEDIYLFTVRVQSPPVQYQNWKTKLNIEYRVVAKSKMSVLLFFFIVKNRAVQVVANTEFNLP